MPTHRIDEDQGSDQLLLQEYEYFLAGKAEGTIEAYLRTVRQLMDWIAVRPGSSGHFQQGFTPLSFSTHLDVENVNLADEREVGAHLVSVVVLEQPLRTVFPNLG